MDEIQLNDWQEFECKIKDLRKEFQEPRQLVFRGVADSTWPLKTTLERCQSIEMSFADYYRVITVVQPHIQSFTKTTWDEIEPYQEIEGMAAEYDKLDFHLWGSRLRAYDLPAFFGPVITGEQRQLKFVVRLRVLPGQREPALPTSAFRHPSQP